MHASMIIVYGQFTRENVNDDDDDDELSMSFVICFEKRQLVLECIVSTSGLNI
jgi:hypothetical protein